jgi:Transposase DDE domain/Transposase domain (DUF772)
MKVQRICETTPEIHFISPKKEFEQYWNSFLGSRLGGIYQCIPWKEITKSLKLKEYRKGPKKIFSPQGMLAMMVLKSYEDCSDRKLIEHLNGNIDFQLFCGIFLGVERITNYKIVSEIRCQLSKKLNIKALQKVLAHSWKPHIQESNIMLTDATCYETSLRYPTNVKLLWESVDWSYGQMVRMCKYLKIRTPRNKYPEQRAKYMNYSRKRKKTKKETTVRIRSLLYLLDKLLGLLKEIEQKHSQLEMPRRYYKRIRTIKTVLKQQQQMFETGESVPNRVVSLSKSYIRPIVRGKEVKSVEFGAKVNMIQFGGINFIEHLSFNAFHEGIRLKESVRYGRDLVGKITHVSGDDIYATNANRSWCASHHIVHGFKRKGRAGKYEDQRKAIATVLRKERATRMEGSFGTEKEYYGLQKIKARTMKNEMLWIFFGVHTANAVRIAKRMAQEKRIQQVA